MPIPLTGRVSELEAKFQLCFGGLHGFHACLLSSGCRVGPFFFFVVRRRLLMLFEELVEADRVGAAVAPAKPPPAWETLPLPRHAFPSPFLFKCLPVPLRGDD